MSTEELLARLERALAPLAAVQAAVLYGSRVSGRARQDSDIDVAVLLDKPPSATERKQLLWNLLEALGRELRSDRIDLVLLNDAPPKLAFHVLKHGREAFVRDPVALRRFRVRTYSLHADYQPIERWFRAVTKRRAQPAGRLG